ncbi:MAG: AAA family ATPase [Candidatus Omnitrophota bacterium]
MGYVIAMAGKGGTGKSTITALIIRLIRERKLGSILAIDADPNSNLAEILGLDPKGTVGEILDKIAANLDKIPSGMSKDSFIEYEVQTSVVEAEGFDVLTMGRPEGPGCYCYVNNVLRNIIEKLIKEYDYVVIDNEAGLEHLSRRTTRSADALVVISDATKVGLRSAYRINELAKELKIKIKKRLLIINRYDDEIDIPSIKDIGLERLGAIPQDNNIIKASLNGDSLLALDDESKSLNALRKMGDKIWQKS